MTTIVFRDGILAADTGLFYGGDWVAATVCQKIHRLTNSRLFGACGDSGDCVAVQLWLDGAREKPKVAERFGALVVQPEHNGVAMLNAPELADCFYGYEPYHVIGSGTAVALGALFQGATAIEAIRAAARHDTTTRLPIDWLDMNGNGGRVE